MTRSEVNSLMREALDFMGRHGFLLPPFVTWPASGWDGRGEDCDEIRDNMLGWDITDFGSGDFDRVGLLLITIRNGSLGDARYPKPYAEKVMIVREGQVTPTHFHWHKMEDIINRGGGDLMVKVHNSTAEDALADTEVTVSVDGRRRRLEAGSVVRLRPGESITMSPRLYHSFWGDAGLGTVLVGEVSQVNDDTKDNRFLEPAGRFPSLIEDEKPLYLLCNEYPRKKGGCRAD
jgi:D-lyxose ketol-isomerase